MPNYDVYGYYHDVDHWIITKNGENFLTCVGNEDAAKNIVSILQEDSDRCAEEKTS